MEANLKPGDEIVVYAVDDDGVLETAKVVVWVGSRAYFARPINAYRRASTVELHRLHLTPEAAIAAWRSELHRQAEGYEEMARRTRARASLAPRIER